MTSPAIFLGKIRIRRRLKSYAGVALLLGLTAGLGMLSIAGARRTLSAYPRFLRSANASTLVVTTPGNYDESTNATIAAFPEVVQSRTYVGFDVSILDSDGRPDPTFGYEGEGTFDGRFIDQDRFTPVKGRQSNLDGTGTPPSPVPTVSATSIATPRARSSARIPRWLLGGVSSSARDR
jgi:hypothetical protein